MSAAEQELRERGHLVARGVLTPEEVQTSIRELDRLSAPGPGSDRRIGRGLMGRGSGWAWTLPDGVSKTPAFWDVITKPPLVALVREALGPEARYLQHSDLHVGFSAVIWHRDNVNRRFGVGPDWDESAEPYRLLRVAVYLESFAESGVALGLVPGSCRADGGLPAPERRRIEHRVSGWRQVVSLLAGRNPLGPWATWVPAQAGDAVLFDPRILHSGSFIHGLKHSLFLAYGVPGSHFTRHRRYYRDVRRELGYRALDPALVARLRAASLFAPEEEGGALPQAYRPSRFHTLLGRTVRPRVDP